MLNGKKRYFGVVVSKKDLIAYQDT